MIFYLTNDLRSLEEILFKASQHLLKTYNVSLLDCFSTASLAMKIFRTKFMKKVEIPILPKFYDEILRKTYYGGVVNIFNPIGKNLYHSDVNSLYPWAMKKPMPGKFIKAQYRDINIDLFFGFILAQVIIPKKVKIPYAPVKINDSLICPVGKIKGIFFSEELKFFKKCGYKVITIYGYEHEKIYPFNDYIDHFYDKKIAKGGERYITKLLLNGLYGFFGRKPIEEIIEVVDQNKLDRILKRFDTRFTIEFDDSNYAIVKRDISPDLNLWHSQATPGCGL